MPKPFAKLRYAMEEADIERADIARLIGREAAYVNQRFRGEYPWKLDEIYAILDLLKVSPSLMAEYFPKEKVARSRV